jgi:hypothetical protein
VIKRVTTENLQDPEEKEIITALRQQVSTLAADVKRLTIEKDFLSTKVSELQVNRVQKDILTENNVDSAADESDGNTSSDDDMCLYSCKPQPIVTQAKLPSLKLGECTFSNISLIYPLSISIS